MYRLFIICLLFLVVACDASKKQTQLPKIYIVMPQGVGWDSKDSCAIDYIDAYGDSTRLKADIKCRGGLSSRYGKHSYSLELEEGFPLCGLPEEDDWVINASYIDKTFMRHKLSYDLFRQMDEDNLAPQSRYVRVFYNGENHGLYLMMQRVNRSLLGVKKKDTAAYLFKEPDIFYDQQKDTNSRLTNIYDQKHPSFKKHNKNEVLDDLNHFIYNSSDEEFLSEVYHRFDKENLLDWHLLLLLTNNDDGVVKNFYCYDLGDGKGMRFIPWDYDHSFGRDGNGDRNDLERNVFPAERAKLLARLMTIESSNNNYVRELAQRYHEHRESGVFSVENLSNMITDMRIEIEPYLQENFNKWPLNGAFYTDDNDFEKEVGIINDYLPRRFKMLDQRFDYK